MKSDKELQRLADQARNEWLVDKFNVKEGSHISLPEQELLELGAASGTIYEIDIEEGFLYIDLDEGDICEVPLDQLELPGVEVKRERH